MAISNKIKLIRGSLSLGEFATKLSTDEYVVYKGNVKKYEDGDVTPSTEFYRRMAIVFNVNLNWLIADKGPMLMVIKGSSIRKVSRKQIVSD